MMETIAHGDDLALYLLGFSNDLRLASHNNVNDEDLEILRQYGIKFLNRSGVLAWYKEIDREQFEGAQGERNLSDLEWLTPRVIAHETVVSVLCSHGAFYPSRFGSLFSCEEALTQLINDAVTDLQSFFGFVGNRREWGVKFFGNARHAVQRIAKDVGLVGDQAASGGASYLKLRRLQRDRSVETRSHFQETFAHALTSLGSKFEDHVCRPIKSRVTESEEDEVIGNVAVLQSDAQVSELQQWLGYWNDRYEDTSLRAELTGPWPAYSFCPSLGSSAKQKRAA